MRRAAQRLCVLLVACGVAARAQSPTRSEHVERGYLSPAAYTNAFFGFKIAIPQGIAFQELRSRKELLHGEKLLFGLHSAEDGGTGWAITAAKATGTHAVTAKGAASRVAQNVERATIDGRDFWKALRTERTRDGVMRQASYAVKLNGYVVDFYVSSRNDEIFVELCKAIEGSQWFAPEKAEAKAGADSIPYSRE